MPRNVVVQREYQRRWMAERRASFFRSKMCIDCGDTENLELDHVDPSTKVNHKVWSWAEARRQEELSKCVVRCHGCHVAKSRRSGEFSHPGELNGRCHISEEMALTILTSLESSRQLAERYGIGVRHVQKIRKGEKWSYLRSLTG